jgi:hypothetical protein
MVPVVGVDHAPTTSVATMEAYTVAPPISAAVLIPPVRVVLLVAQDQKLYPQSVTTMLR